MDAKTKPRALKKTIGFPIAITILLLLNACNSEVKLIYTSNQINQLTDTITYKSIRKAFWSQSLILKTKNKEKIVLAHDSIWGCVYKDKIFYRYYRGAFYPVKERDNIFIYSTYHSSGKSGHTHFYFSKTPDSEMFTLDKKNIAKQFSDNYCLLQKGKDLKWYQSYADYNRKTQSYRITEFYKECNTK
ncbi:MAG: hypothetical protein ACOZCO_07240 [Bacteroidota bacterium]